MYRHNNICVYICISAGYISANYICGEYIYPLSIHVVNIYIYTYISIYIYIYIYFVVNTYAVRIYQLTAKYARSSVETKEGPPCVTQLLLHMVFDTSVLDIVKQFSTIQNSHIVVWFCGNKLVASNGAQQTTHIKYKANKRKLSKSKVSYPFAIWRDAEVPGGAPGS